MKNTLSVFAFAVLLLLFPNISKSQTGMISIMPKPLNLQVNKGVYKITNQTVIIAASQSARQDAEVFNQYLSQFYGISLPVTAGSDVKSGFIKLIVSTDPAMPQDAYKMFVSPDSVRIEGRDAGIFYGLQSLRQLLPAKKSSSYDIPCVNIYDYPQYSWRGMHLDVCRHFFTTAEVKEYIDLIAFYKMNVFHWHFTDDQGWRIMIDKYPKLTSVGGYRSGTLIGRYTETNQKFDTIRYGGYYTKEDIREIVRYAGERHILVVPEIEMPGHAMAAIAAYPEYSCTGNHFETSKLWGVFDDVFCSKDETIYFLEDVLTEVMALFPGKYIHIGGDECPKTRWKTCPNCQAVMKREGLKDENELQSYFVRTIEKFVNSKGKTIIGWNEILEGGLAPNAVVMSWQGTEGGIAAANQKHDVIMTPGEYCYLDHYQGNRETEPLAIGGYTTTEKVYSYDPMPKELKPEQRMYILGAQGNLWTEYIPDFRKVEYMALPRMIALSEVLWLPVDKKNYPDFAVRLKTHLALLDMMGINHAKPK